MKKMKYLFGVTAVAAGLLLGVSQANAAYTYTVLGDGGLLGGFSVSLDSQTESGILVGGIHVKSNSGVPGFNDFISVCLDLRGRLYLNASYSFEQVAFAGQTGLNPSWGNPLGAGGQATPAAAFQAINNAAHLYATIQPSSPAQWAALQLAVWKALYDTDSTGKIVTGAGSRFGVNQDQQGAWALAQTWLQLGPNDGDWARTKNYIGYILQPGSRDVQELLVGVTPTGDVPAVPEPSTVVAGALLLLPLGVSAMRRFRKE